ncbi:MAG: FAD-binding oxidoreductase [Parcubacteria group bacterium]|nr:FAD-binding oxidoreductase [Parcubacteria group bacterium]
MSQLVLDKLKIIFGAENVFVQGEVLTEKSRDCWPANLFENKKNRHLPLAVVRPLQKDLVPKLQALVRLTLESEPKLKIIARGGGSGVCGAANCSGGEIVMDMSGLRYIEILSWPNGGKSGEMLLAPGASGEDIDHALKLVNPRFTAKHYPASYYVSTVGGWVNTNASGHYGRISTFVKRVDGVDGSGRFVSLAGSELDKVLGMEGTTLLVTAVLLPIFELPSCDGFLTLRFYYLEDTADFLCWLQEARQSFDHDLGVEVLTARFYDWFDYKLIAKPHRGDSYKPDWYKRVEYFFEKRFCRLGRWSKSLRGFAERRQYLPWTGVIYMVGASEENVEEIRHILESKCEEIGGQSLGPTIARSWYDYRFKLGYDKLVARFKVGIVADTFDCTPSWETLVSTYENVREAAFRYGIAGAHIILDKEGPYIYFTFAMAGAKKRKYDLAWAKLFEACISSGARTNHHHGIGRLKAGRLCELAQFAYGIEWYAHALQVKREMDPGNIFNPGNLV